VLVATFLGAMVANFKENMALWVHERKLEVAKLCVSLTLSLSLSLSLMNMSFCPCCLCRHHVSFQP